MKENNNKENQTEKKLTFLEHLEELRLRLIICIISVSLMSIIGYFISGIILEWLLKPAKNSFKVVYFLSPLEAFNTRLKIALVAGIILASPIIIYQIWKFIKPALKPAEQKIIKIASFFSIFLFILGSTLAYWIIIPLGLRFLMQYATESVQPWIRVRDYISLVLILLIAMGGIFQLPLIMVGLAKAGLIHSKFLSKNRKIAIFMIVFFAAAITPGGDPFTLIAVALPLYLLYEVSLFLVKIFEK